MDGEVAAERYLIVGRKQLAVGRIAFTPEKVTYSMLRKLAVGRITVGRMG